MSNEIQFLLYNMPDADGKVQVVIKGETLWCTQKAMAQLFGVGVPAISKHLKNIFDEGELAADSVISKMETTAADGKNYTTTSLTKFAEKFGNKIENQIIVHPKQFSFENGIMKIPPYMIPCL